MNWFKDAFFGVFLGIQEIGFYTNITNYLYTFDRCEGNSMQPTLPYHSVAIVDKILWKWFGIKKGDIITAKMPISTNEQICKRVVAVEGEIVNGIKIPKNHIWIEGDNKKDSLDSRYFGPISLCLVTGKLLMNIYPFKIFKKNIEKPVNE